MTEAELLEQRLEHVGFGRRELDELEALGASLFLSAGTACAGERGRASTSTVHGSARRSRYAGSGLALPVELSRGADRPRGASDFQPAGTRDDRLGAAQAGTLSAIFINRTSNRRRSAAERTSTIRRSRSTSSGTIFRKTIMPAAATIPSAGSIKRRKQRVIVSSDPLTSCANNEVAE